jgi:hypothetical protein
MTTVTALPTSGNAFFDLRDGGRSLRVAAHPSEHILVLSIWRGRTCAATFQLDRDTARELIKTLGENLGEPER